MKPGWIAGSAAILTATGAVVFYLASGAYDFGADSPHWKVTRAAIEAFRDHSIDVRAQEIVVPDLKDDQMVSKGAGQYAAMCVNCHLAPGMKDSEIRSGLYPQPPNLSELRVDPKRAFWVVKHGLKMSGMPAWGLGHDDEALWSIVAFVTKLPGLSEDHYKQMVADAPPDEEMGGMKMEGGKVAGSGAGKDAADGKQSGRSSADPKGGQRH